MKKLILIISIILFSILAIAQNRVTDTQYLIVRDSANMTNAQIKHMAAGTDQTDAVNVNQLSDSLDNFDVNPVDSLSFEYTAPPSIGETPYTFYTDTSNMTISMRGGDTETLVQLGEELRSPLVLNNTGNTIENARVVFINGTSANKATIAKADKSTYETTRTIGVATQQILDGAEGRVTRFGYVSGDFSTFSQGAVYVGDSITDTYGLTQSKPSGGDFSIYVGEIVIASSNGILLVNPYLSEHTVEVDDTKGWPIENKPTLSFNDATRYITLTPSTGTEFYNYQGGEKYIYEADSVQTADTEGLVAVYYNGYTLTAVSNPSESQIETVIRNFPIVAYAYRDTTNDEFIYKANELHTIGLINGTNHALWHFNIGAKYQNGMDVEDIITDGNGSLNTHAQFGIASGVFTDEDLPQICPTIASTTGLRIFYKTGANGDWRTTTNSGYSFISGASLPQYNEFTGGAWQLTEMTSGNYILVHVFGVNDEDDKYVAIVGEAEYATLGAAQAGAEDEINQIQTSGLPAAEIIPMYTMVLEGKTSLANSVNARYQPATSDGADAVDWRRTGGTGSGTSGGTGTTILANEVVYDNTNSGIDATNVQDAIDTINENAVYADAGFSDNAIIVGDVSGKNVQDRTATISDAGDLTVNGDITADNIEATSVDVTDNYYVNGSPISSGDLSDASNLVTIDGTQTITGLKTFNTGTSDILRLSRGSNLMQFSGSSAASGGFGLYDRASLSYQWYVKNGKFGIGTTTPSTELEVNGDITADNTEATSVDVTDNYYINGSPISSGDLSDASNLVTIDGTQTITGAKTFERSNGLTTFKRLLSGGHIAEFTHTATSTASGIFIESFAPYIAFNDRSGETNNDFQILVNSNFYLKNDSNNDGTFDLTFLELSKAGDFDFQSGNITTTGDITADNIEATGTITSATPTLSTEVALVSTVGDTATVLRGLIGTAGSQTLDQVMNEDSTTTHSLVITEDRDLFMGDSAGINFYIQEDVGEGYNLMWNGSGALDGDYGVYPFGNDLYMYSDLGNVELSATNEVVIDISATDEYNFGATEADFNQNDIVDVDTLFVDVVEVSENINLENTSSINFGVVDNIMITSGDFVGIGSSYTGSASNSVFVGTDVGRNNNSDYSVFIGDAAANRGTGSGYSVFIGSQAGYQSTSSYNIGIGVEAARNTVTSSGFIALGHEALKLGVGVDTTTALGYQAGYDSEANNSVYLGYQAGYQNTTDNRFELKQANINSNPLIHGDFESGLVTIPGSLNTTGNISTDTLTIDELDLNSIANTYLMYSNDGIIDQAPMTTDATDISITNSVNVGDTVKTAKFQMSTGAQSGRYLKAIDTDGNAVWDVVTTGYQTTINGSNGTPTGGTALIDGTGTAGDYYRCSTAGTYDYGNPSGNSITLAVGQDIIYNSSNQWEALPVASDSTIVNDFTGNIVLYPELSGNSINIRGNTTTIDISNATSVALNSAKETNATHTGHVTGSAALTIANNVITEAMLNATNSPSGGQILTYNAGGSNFTWSDESQDLNDVLTIDSDAGNNDITNVDTLEANLVHTPILANDDGNIELKAKANFTHTLDIGGTNEYIFYNNLADFEGNNLTDVGSLFAVNADLSGTASVEDNDNSLVPADSIKAYVDRNAGGSTATDAYQTLSTSGAVTFNVSTSRNAKMSITGNVTLTVSNLVNGGIEPCLRVTPHATTDYTLTFSSGYYFANGHSNVFTIEAGSSKIYKFKFDNDGTTTIVDYLVYE